MKQNPYRKAFEPGQTSLQGQQNAFTDNSGEINANSVNDLLQQIGKAMQQGPELSRSARIQANREKQVERSQLLSEAVADPSGESFTMLGEAIRQEIHETTNRQGFARNLMQYNELGQGETNQVTLKQKNVVGFIATSPTQVTPNEIREKRFIPPEFHMNCYILIDTAELSQSGSDLLEEKYEEGLEGIMVQEDRLWKQMADRAASVRNTVQSFGSFTPAVFARMLNQVSRWGIPTFTATLSSSLWEDVISNGDFAGVLDPVTKWELLQEGYLGRMYGVDMMTDSFRQNNLKVLNPGEMYITGAPINTGVISVRSNIVSQPINRYSQGEAKLGWFIDQLESVVLGNVLSVCKGQKQ